MLRQVHNVQKVSLSRLKVSRHIETSPWCISLSQTQNTINFFRNAVLFTNKEKFERMNAPLETLKTDLVLDFFALNVDQVSVFLRLCDKIGDLEVLWGRVRVISITLAVLAVAALDQHPVGTSIIDQLHFLVTLTDKDRTGIIVVGTVHDIQLDVVAISGLTKAMNGSAELFFGLFHLRLPLELLNLVFKYSVGGLLRSEENRWIREQVALVSIIKLEVIIVCV